MRGQTLPSKTLVFTGASWSLSSEEAGVVATGRMIVRLLNEEYRPTLDVPSCGEPDIMSARLLVRYNTHYN